LHFSEALSQRGDVHAKVVLFNERAGPYIGDELVLADNLARALDERDQ
jgi:hypothetical protein